MNSGIFRFLMWLFLITVGFVVGVAWKNKDPQSATTSLATTNEEGILGEEALPTKLATAERATIKLFEDASQSVVFITTSVFQRDYFSRSVTESPQGSGSGFVWDDKGHIITNYHVIQGADKAQVTLSHGESYSATLVGAAPDKDLAVLKINAPTNKLRPLPVGDSEGLRVGQFTYAIGNPFGLDQTLTTGIISALGREIQSVSGLPIRDVIQTDAAINPGNSGGPLLNSSGKLIGVNTAIYSPSGAYAGIGFSIPVDVVKWVVPELIAYGRIKRPTLGVELATPRIVARLGLSGALVMEVVRGGAAAKAGVRPTMIDRYGAVVLGDVIVKLNNEAITSSNDLILALEKYKPGDTVSLTVLRDKKETKLNVVLDTAR